MLALISGWRVCLSFGSNLVVQEVKVFRGGAIDIEPPVADKVLLVEESSVGAEETVLDEVGVPKVGADVEGLALSFGVGIVTLEDRTININPNMIFKKLCTSM